MPDPVISKFVPEFIVIVNGSAPLLKTTLSSSTVELLKRFVTSEVKKVAMSDGPFGTVFGTQLVAVFQSALDRIHAPRCTARHAVPLRGQ